MLIALAQTGPAKGDVTANASRHVELAMLAADAGADLVVFPELSLTGYWPELAGALAIDPDDGRLDALQRVSDERGIVIAAGAPTPADPPKPRISLVILSPAAPRRVYSKQYLHEDEEPFFTPGERSTGILGDAPRIGLAICYELSVPAHAEASLAAGAEIYLASVAKTAAGVVQASERLAEISRRSGIPSLMVNCVGPSGDGDCAGATAAWSRDGRLLDRLDGSGEGLLVVDAAGASAVPVPARPGRRG